MIFGLLLLEVRSFTLNSIGTATPLPTPYLLGAIEDRVLGRVFDGCVSHRSSAVYYAIGEAESSIPIGGAESSKRSIMVSRDTP